MKIKWFIIVNIFILAFSWGIWIYASINGGQYAFMMVIPLIFIFLIVNILSIKNIKLFIIHFFSIIIISFDVYYANIKANNFVKNEILKNPCNYNFNDDKVWRNINNYQQIHSEYGFFAMKHILVTRKYSVDYGYMDSRWFSILDLCKNK